MSMAYFDRILRGILVCLSLQVMGCGGFADREDGGPEHLSRLSGVYDQQIVLRLSEDSSHRNNYRFEVCLVDENLQEDSLTIWESSCVGAIRSENGENVLLSSEFIQNFDLSADEIEIMKRTHREYNDYLESLAAAPLLNSTYTIGGATLLGGAAGVGYYKLVTEPDLKKLADLRQNLLKTSNEWALIKAVSPDVISQLETSKTDLIGYVKEVTYKTLNHRLSVSSTDQARHVRDIMDQALSASVSSEGASTLLDPQRLIGRDHIYSQKFIDFVSQIQPEFDSAQKVHYALQTPQFYRPKIAHIYREWIARGYTVEEVFDEVFFEPFMKFSRMESMIHYAVQNIGSSHLTPSWIRHLSAMKFPFTVDAIGRSLSKGENHVMLSARDFVAGGGRSSMAQLSIDWMAKYESLMKTFPRLNPNHWNASTEFGDELSDLRSLKAKWNNRFPIMNDLEKRLNSLSREVRHKSIRFLAKNILGAMVLVAVSGAGLNALITWVEGDFQAIHTAAQPIIKKYDDLKRLTQQNLTTDHHDRVRSVPQVLEALSVWVSLLHATDLLSQPYSVCVPQKTDFDESVPSFKVSCVPLPDLS